jgi:hypothetical protein
VADENRRVFSTPGGCLNGIPLGAGGPDGRLRKNPDDEAASMTLAMRRILTVTSKTKKGLELPLSV